MNSERIKEIQMGTAYPESTSVKQALLQVWNECAQDQLRITKDSKSLPDIRNKLSPITNLIAMIENGLVKGSIELHPLVIQEIEQCKKSIEYLSGKDLKNDQTK